ncbi:GNAT family N-acetyltransferase [Labrys wisconsinensis]|uniref:Acetyltransferase n=1 Tax=Labrys wisconsinensis TaxID=425677 RepID=A0ABU0J9F1_9HYPH|nr:GNAT family N-acetyltransferase [Labrys wisconsinensis]MDQ0470906.1 putative acetyltransferase [Labrys wisconsinensis]
MARPLQAALRPFLPADGPILAAIFRAAIEELASDDYDEDQQAAWASAADDEAAFGARLAGELTLVATVSGAPVGFAALKGAEEIDMLYVHPGVAGQGVARLLVDALEKLAAARGAKVLRVDASDTARDFFSRRGFEARHRQTVQLGGEWLGNTRMEKRLAGKPA